MLSVVYDECHILAFYAKCRYAECRGAFLTTITTLLSRHRQTRFPTLTYFESPPTTKKYNNTDTLTMNLATSSVWPFKTRLVVRLMVPSPCRGWDLVTTLKTFLSSSPKKRPNKLQHSSLASLFYVKPVACTIKKLKNFTILPKARLTTLAKAEHALRS